MGAFHRKQTVRAMEGHRGFSQLHSNASLAVWCVQVLLSENAKKVEFFSGSLLSDSSTAFSFSRHSARVDEAASGRPSSCCCSRLVLQAALCRCTNSRQKNAFQDRKSSCFQPGTAPPQF